MAIAKAFRAIPFLVGIALLEHAERGDSVVVSESGNTFTVKVR
jgi:hypothetical protein